MSSTITHNLLLMVTVPIKVVKEIEVRHEELKLIEIENKNLGITEKDLLDVAPEIIDKDDTIDMDGEDLNALQQDDNSESTASDEQKVVEELALDPEAIQKSEIYVSPYELMQHFIKNNPKIVAPITTIPFNDGKENKALFLFTTHKANLDKALTKLRNLQIYGEGGLDCDVSILALAVNKKLKSEEDMAAESAGDAVISAHELMSMNQPSSTRPQDSTRQAASQNFQAATTDIDEEKDQDRTLLLSEEESQPQQQQQAQNNNYIPDSDRHVNITEKILNNHTDTDEGINVNFNQKAIIDDNIVAGIKDNKVEAKSTVFDMAQFKEGLRSKIAVENVLDLVHQSAKFSFDYLALCIVASILACIGLIVNSVVVIVASMLVSPLMGPILAVTFGLTVGDYGLVKVGLFSELLGLLICIIVGYIGGLIAAPASLLQQPWPSEEMLVRGTVEGLYIGICIALPSGFGVALSVLGENTSSLVGVAISASLLPPAVNTGVLLAFATLHDVYYPNNDSGYSVSQIAGMAGLSFLLTVLNIVCIWITGVAMFKLKEVTPIPDKTEFWTTHIPETRHYNKVLRKDDPMSVNLKEKIAELVSKSKREAPISEADAKRNQEENQKTRVSQNGSFVNDDYNHTFTNAYAAMRTTNAGRRNPFAELNRSISSTSGHTLTLNDLDSLLAGDQFNHNKSNVNNMKLKTENLDDAATSNNNSNPAETPSIFSGDFWNKPPPESTKSTKTPKPPHTENPTTAQDDGKIDKVLSKIHENNLS